MLMRLIKFIFIFSFLLSLSGCYHLTIQQGNILTPNDVNAVHRGMTQEEVIAILGRPILVNVYAENRTVYVYTLQPGGKKMRQRHLIVYFQYGRVTGIRTNVTNEINDSTK